MESIPLLNEFLIVFVLSIVVLLSCHRFRIPAVVGFLLTGVLCGPYGFALVEHIDDVQTLANIGIILLLFTVGMEISVKKILEIKKLFFVGGMLQIGLTVLVGFLGAKVLGRSTGESIFLGCLFSLSSTAVVLRMMSQKGESDTPHGRGTLAILIFQDFCAVPMMLITPFLAGADIDLNWGLLFSAAKGVVIIVAVFAAAWYLVPTLLYYVAQTRIRELFLLTVFSICMGVAWFSQLAGLSLSLGAFLAGLIISQSDFSHEAISDIAPFQNLFTSFFFVSVGMLLDVNFVVQHPFLILFLTTLIILFKSTMTTIAGLAAGLSIRTAAWMGMALAQVSEFSFVLASVGKEYGISPPYNYQLFLSVAILSIALTPWLIAYAHTWAGWWDKLPFPEGIKNRVSSQKAEEKELKDHVIIVGYGVAGRALAKSCKESQIPYVIVEMNAATVREEHRKGEPIYYGDAGHESVLEYAKLEHAKVIAIVINDAAAGVRIIKKVKELNKVVNIIVRTRYVQDVKFLYALGANDVVPDEYGTAVEVFTRVLHNYSIPKEKIQQVVTNSLIEGYDLLRMQYWPTIWSTDVHLLAKDIAVKSYRIDPEGHDCGKPLSEWKGLLDKDLMLVALQRAGTLITDINSSIILEKDDVIVVIGTLQSVKAARDELCLVTA